MSAPEPPARGRLREADIVTAAIALVDVEGLGALTMRRLGAALDVEAMSLYRYFPSRHALLDALVDRVVDDVAAHPDSQWRRADDWRDYLERIAHGVRQMALTHPRLFPLVVSHPTAAPWIRPPIRSLDWIDAFLRNLQDHHFPPPAAVSVYKRFTTMLLGHLLLEVAALGLEFDDDRSEQRRDDGDRRAARTARSRHAEQAADVVGDEGPTAEEIVAATPRPLTVADEPAVQALAPELAAHPDADGVDVGLDVPIAAAVNSTVSLQLDRFPFVRADAGLLAADSAAGDFARALASLLDDVAATRRP